MQLRLLALLAAITPFAIADIEFTTPTAGAKLTGGGSINIAWKDSGNAPSISDLMTYQLFLCAGGNDDGTFIQLTSITQSGTFANGNKAVGTISAGVGASTPSNAYFLKIISVAKEGGTVTNYSPRFSLAGMTGTFPANVLAGAQAVTGTDGPPTVNQVNNGNNAAPAAASDYAVPYTMQTGLTKYAPMQPVPPSKITKKSPTPQYPTSAVSLASTFLPTPKQVTTMTMSQTFSVSSMENTAAAAPMPSDDMAKFLARWKD
ncbi:beta-1,6-glucan boisynthesis protein-like protein [Glonium stellatum]|uniref:Beta-1,6-glucan boisynthesis protein-like protein n=1 Tax=Glonium stellatum TaxID=574774 RepID=A0A8E2FBN0_9PEZI|nr:beta-1,6-glucan boisynthesis protein-like protein [Glonium stellatum]